MWCTRPRCWLKPKRLQRLGAPDLFSRLRIHPQALLITPFHQAANRIRELARGDGRHGSCGVGVGETYEDALRDAEGSLRAEDLSAPGRLRSKLRAIRSRKQAELAPLAASAPAGTPLAHEWEYFRRPEIIDAWIEAAAPLARAELLGGDELLADWLAHTPAAIFEGALGVLLDADAGFHPYTTWSRCTTANARALIERLAPQAERSRSALPARTPCGTGRGRCRPRRTRCTGVISEHNQRNAWQGGVRYGWWDAVLLRYALQVNGGVDCLASRIWMCCRGWTRGGTARRTPQRLCRPGFRAPDGRTGSAARIPPARRVEPGAARALYTGTAARSALPARHSGG